MNESEKIVLLIDAIKNNWAVCDDRDEDSFMVLVNADRDEREDFKPSKELVAKLENEGLVELDESRSDLKGQERSFNDFFGKITPIPFVYMYKITKKGHEFYKNQKKP